MVPNIKQSLDSLESLVVSSIAFTSPTKVEYIGHSNTDLRDLDTSLKLIRRRLAVIEGKIHEAEKSTRRSKYCFRRKHVENARDTESLIVEDNILQSLKN